jgi:hypothetical protein
VQRIVQMTLQELLDKHPNTADEEARAGGILEILERASARAEPHSRET